MVMSGTRYALDPRDMVLAKDARGGGSLQYFNRECKHNFVDKHNKVVGFDSSECCCENAGWMITAELPKTLEDEQLPDMVWGEAVFAMYEQPVVNALGKDIVDEGGSVSFKLITAAQQTMWLTLYNCHNGYYGHGFDVKIEGAIMTEGCL